MRYCHIVVGDNWFIRRRVSHPSFPEGFGFEGSSLITGLMSFGLGLTTGLVSSVIEVAFDRPGSLFLEVEAAAAEGFVFAEDRAG